MKSLFGTDGIRGITNQHPMTPWVTLKVGMAMGKLLKSGRVIIGKDTRLSGYIFEYALSSGLCATGLDVYLVGPFPTPGIAFLVPAMRVEAGIVVSASHNPFYYNGIKIFGKDGYKISDETEQEIENFIKSGGEDVSILATPRNTGKAFRLKEAAGRYIEFLKNTLPKGVRLKGIKVVIDCANGATYRIAPMLFDELGAEVVVINAEPDGLNINEGCGATEPSSLREAVLKYGADVGFAFDGDGDRCIATDEKGKILNGDDILAICGDFLLKRKLIEKRGVVVTHASTIGIERFFNERGCEVVRTEIGDRYVVEAMLKHGFQLGGEKSGHTVFLNYSTTGDGLITSLQVLNAMINEGAPLSVLSSIFEKPYEFSIDIPVRTKIPLEKIKGYDRFKKEMDSKLNSGRIHIRYSGTEPKLRILVEGYDEENVNSVGKEIREFFLKNLDLAEE